MTLLWTPRSRSDLATIYDWIVQRNRRAAIAVVSCIRERAEMLEQFPGIGRPTEVAGLRVLPVVRYPYLVYHRVAEDEVTIVHVRHSSRAVPKADEFGN